MVVLLIEKFIPKNLKRKKEINSMKKNLGNLKEKNSNVESI